MNTKKKWLRRALTFALLLLFVGMFIYGFGSNESTTVFQKSSSICMECIGIG